MKTNILNKYFFATAVIVAATSLTGCFRMGSLFSSGSGSGSSQAIPVGSEGAVPAVMEGSQLMSSMSAMTGVNTPSSATKTAFANNSANLAVGGSTTQVAQPLLQATATIAAEFCNDAITQNPTQIYPGIAFSGGGAVPTQFTGATLTNVENAMCQNFWAESPCSASEVSVLNTAAAGCVSNVPATGGSITAATQTQTVAICLCTGMLSSLSAVKH